MIVLAYASLCLVRFKSLSESKRTVRNNVSESNQIGSPIVRFKLPDSARCIIKDPALIAYICINIYIYIHNTIYIVLYPIVVQSDWATSIICEHQTPVGLPVYLDFVR